MANDKVLIYGDIGAKVDGDVISQQLRDLAKKSNEIDVHINSYGGDVQQGVSIFSTIVSLNGEGKQINTFIDGFAASIASIIAIAGKKIYMNDFARIMVHNAAFGMMDESRLNDKEKEALNQINDMLAQILSRRNVDKDTIKQKMKDETWITSAEAKDLGLVDDIMETQATLRHRAELILSSSEMENSKKLNYINNLLGESAVTTVNYPNFNHKNTVKMDKLKAKLQISDTSEDNIIAKFDAIKDENDKLKNEKSELETENEALKKEKIERMKSEITALIDVAIEKGQLSEEKRDDLITQAIKAPETVKNMLEMMPTKPESKEGSLSKEWMQAQAKGSGTEKEEELAKEYQNLAENNPQALRDLQAKHPERFEKIQKAWLNI